MLLFVFVQKATNTLAVFRYQMSITKLAPKPAIALACLGHVAVANTFLWVDSSHVVPKKLAPSFLARP